MKIELEILDASGGGDLYIRIGCRDPIWIDVKEASLLFGVDYYHKYKDIRKMIDDDYDSAMKQIEYTLE